MIYVVVVLPISPLFFGSLFPICSQFVPSLSTLRVARSVAYLLRSSDKIFSGTYDKQCPHARKKDRALSKAVSWARRRFCLSVGRKGRQVWLLACWQHGLACHPCCETRRSKESGAQDADTPTTDG